MEITKLIFRLFKESSLYSLGNFANKLLLFLMVPLYAHFILPADLSLLEILEPVEQFAYAIFHLGLTHAFFKHFKLNEYSEESITSLYSTLFWFLFLEGAVIVLLLTLFSEPLVDTLLPTHPLAQICFYLMLASLFFRLLNMLTSSYYRVTGKVTMLIGWTLLGTTLFCSINYVALVIFEENITYVFAARLFLLFPIFISGIVLARRFISFTLNIDLLKKLIKFSYPFILAAASMPILNFFDRWMLQKFIDAEATGIYGISYRFGMIPSMLLVAPFLSAWQPIIYEEQGVKTQAKLYRRVLLYYTLIAGSIWFLLSIFSNELIIIFTSEAYYSGHIIIPLVAASNVFYGLGWILIAGLAVEGRTLFIGLCTFFAAVANVVLNYILIPKFGILGAAYATLGSFLILFIGYGGYSRKHLQIRWPYQRFFTIVVLLILFYMLSGLLSFENIRTAILIKGLLSIPVIILLGYIAGFTPAKIRAIKEFIKESSGNDRN